MAELCIDHTRTATTRAAFLLVLRQGEADFGNGQRWNQGPSAASAGWRRYFYLVR